MTSSVKPSQVVPPSLAAGQRAIHNHDLTYPLWPPLTAGCPRSSSVEMAYPLEITYDYSGLCATATEALFNRDQMPDEATAWAPLLPPLDPRLRIGVGSTPLIDVSDIADSTEVLIKDESRNPTWSHKDRLNLCAVSAAAVSGAPGVVVASSGNHGASAAAMSARAGLPCVVVMSKGGPPAVQSFVGAYGATVLAVPREARWGVVKDIVDRLGFQPVSNQTVTHTGHPFGPEGYKTIAFELYIQLGCRAPSAVFVPTGYGELLYGVWKGFEEMQQLGVIAQPPAIYACEVASRGVLATALREGKDAVTVEATPTDAYSLASTTGGYRGVHVMRHTAGDVIGVDDTEMVEAQDQLSAQGMWQELSGAASLAALSKAIRHGATFEGPVVCVATSSGLKDKNALRYGPFETSPDWASLSSLLRRRGLVVDNQSPTEKGTAASLQRAAAPDS